MKTDVILNLKKIIERESKSSTYKFALFRGVIDVIQENSPYIEVTSEVVRIPFGLLVEKWLIYYYPIFQSEKKIPQINGNSQLAFENQLISIINYYEHRGGFSAFYNDLANKGIPDDLKKPFNELVRKIKDTIAKMPMKFIGTSVNSGYYTIFQDDKNAVRKKSVDCDLANIIQDYGTFSIEKTYFDAFRIIGSFVNGQDSILFKWAEFSVTASGQNISVQKVLNELIKSPITQRNINESKKLYREILSREGQFFCVWTGKKMKALQESNIDHVIPFSVWKNNDLWNLLPADAGVNNRKRDKIPSPELIERQKNIILTYWNVIREVQQRRFEKEIQISLLGNRDVATWQTNGLEMLKQNCYYLIENRGFEEWNI